jgi:hypothetical protein
MVLATPLGLLLPLLGLMNWCSRVVEEAAVVVSWAVVEIVLFQVVVNRSAIGLKYCHCFHC